MNKTILNILTVFSVVFLSISIVFIPIYEQLLNPSIYTNALAKSGFYTSVTGVIEDYLTNSIKEFASQQLESLQPAEEDLTVVNIGLFLFADYLINNETETAVRIVLQALEFENRLQFFSEGVIESSVLWASGRYNAPELLQAFPSTEELKELQNSSIIRPAVNWAIASAIGINDLPSCSSREETQSSLRQLNQGNLAGVTCTSNEIQPLIQNSISQIIPEQVFVNIENAYQDFINQYELQPLIDQVYESLFNFAQFREEAINFRTVIQFTGIILYAFLFIGIAMLSAVLFFSKNRISKLLKVIVSIVVSSLLVLLIYSYLIIPLILNNIDLSSLTNPIKEVSPIQSTLLLQNLKYSLELILNSIHINSLHIVFMVALSGLTIFGGRLIYKNKNKIKNFAIKLKKRLIK